MKHVDFWDGVYAIIFCGILIFGIVYLSISDFLYEWNSMGRWLIPKIILDILLIIWWLSKIKDFLHRWKSKN